MELSLEEMAHAVGCCTPHAGVLPHNQSSLKYLASINVDKMKFIKKKEISPNEKEEARLGVVFEFLRKEHPPCICRHPYTTEPSGLGFKFPPFLLQIFKHRPTPHIGIPK